MPKVQLPMGLVIRYQTKKLMTNGTDGRLVVSCVEQETQSTAEKTRNDCAGYF
jgi:hypothetical protein